MTGAYWQGYSITMTGFLLAGVLYHYDGFFYWQGYCITMTGFLLAGVLYHYDGGFTGRGTVSL